MDQPDNNDQQPSVWPPPPTMEPPQPSPPSSDAEVEKLKKYAGMCCALGWLLCVGVQIGTLYFAAKANRVAGRNVATHYFVLGCVQLGILALLILFAMLSPKSIGP